MPPNLNRTTKDAALAAHYADGMPLHRLLSHGGTGADYAAVDDPSNPDYEAFNGRPTAPSALYSTAPTDAAGTCTITCHLPPRLRLDLWFRVLYRTNGVFLYVT